MKALPITIGVTGHRDLLAEDRQETERCLKRAFDDLKRKFPDTPLLLLTPLAEGADRLVADVALKCDAGLFVVLPFAKEEYLKDFEGQGSREEFEGLLSNCRDVRVVTTQVPSTPVERDRAYEDAGRFVAKNSHLLIALWNGEGSEKQGGTAQTLRYKLLGCRDPREVTVDQLGAVEPGRVLQLCVRRKSSPDFPQKKGLYWLKKPENLEAGMNWEFDRQEYAGSVDWQRDLVIAGINEFNRYVSQDRAETGVESPEQIWFRKADQLAIDEQKLSKRVTKSILIAFGVSVVAIQAWDAFPEQVSVIVPGFLVAIALALWGLARWRGWKARYEEHRGLAEALRVQRAWDQAGIDKCVADHYLTLQHSELNWIRRALRTLRLLGPRASSSDPGPGGCADALDGWVDDQLKYFRDKAIPNETAVVRRNRYLKWGCVTLAFIALVPAVAGRLGFGFPGWLQSASPILHAAFLVVAAALVGYAEVYTLEEQVSRYKSVKILFQRVIDMQEMSGKPSIENYQQIKNVLYAVGLEALSENSQWLITRKQRVLKPPT